MSERTKGPWRYERSRFKSDGEYDYAISAVIDGKTRCIGEFFGRVSDDIRPDAAANAAAIVMWEANFDDLVKALDEIECQAVCEPLAGEKEVRRMLNHCRELAAAALAKAKS